MTATEVFRATPVARLSGVVSETVGGVLSIPEEELDTPGVRSDPPEPPPPPHPQSEVLTSNAANNVRKYGRAPVFLLIDIRVLVRISIPTTYRNLVTFV